MTDWENMETIDVLERVGLKGKEASVYLALLELGTASVESIAKKAGTKRPTTYLVLDDLQNRGLVSIVPTAKKILYTAESPQQILSDILRREELLKRFMPNLLAVYNARKEKPQVQMFEGKEGIKSVYQKIYRENELSWFGTTSQVQKYDPDGLWEFVKRTQEERIVVRDLLTRSAEDITYARKAKPGPRYEIRFVRKGSRFFTDNAIFGDNVVFFSFDPQIFAVMITSHEVSQAIKTLFEFAWEAAEPYEKVINSSGKTVLV